MRTILKTETHEIKIPDGAFLSEESPAQYTERLIPTEKFLRRMTKNKLGRIVKLAENNDDLRGMLFIIQSKPHVDLNSDELDSDLQWLVTAGVITQSDKDKLLG